ncbi:MAG TPA: hypothetical protein VN759_06235 [Pseudolysinimonas sp.]|nr:hypothetical protein [Pseudolysinimonas sp.]
MAEDDGGTDPRYDPAFQRGYDGPVRTTLRDTARADPADSDSPRLSEPVTVTPVAAPLVTTAPAAAEPAAVAPVDRATPRDIARNPFYLAVAALAVLAIVAGVVWLARGFASIADDRTTTATGYYAATVMSFGAPLLIGIGIAIFAGLLFVLARGWRPRGGD